MTDDIAQITEHIPGLRRYARALTGNRVNADDLVQDTLERALSRFSLWRRNSNLRAWLFTIMHNIYVNQGRAGYRRELLTENGEHVDEPVRANQEQGLELRDMHRALAQLPGEFRVVVLLVALEQMSYEEVARVLGIPKGTVMSRLSRGREKLRQLMAGDLASADKTTLRRVK